VKEIVVPNDLVSAKKPEQEILEEVSRCGFDESATFAIKLALEEAMTNAVRHGNRSDPSKRVHVWYTVTLERIEILVKDEGPGFVPDLVPDPTLPENIDRPNGRGIMLMKAYLDEVEYCDGGRAVRLVKLKQQSECT